MKRAGDGDVACDRKNESIDRERIDEEEYYADSDLSINRKKSGQNTCLFDEKRTDIP